MKDNETEMRKQKYHCLCCGEQTLDAPPPGSYEICPVCGWEDDLVQYECPDLTGGANKMSLHQAQAAYLHKKSL